MIAIQELTEEIENAIRLSDINTQNTPYILLKVQETLINTSTTDAIYELLETNPVTTLKYITQLIEQKTNTQKKVILTDIPKQPSYITQIHQIREQHFEKLIIIQGIIKRISAIQFTTQHIIFKCLDCNTQTIKKYNTEDKPNKKLYCMKCKKQFDIKEEKTIGIQTIEIEATEQDTQTRNETITCLLQDTLTRPEITQKINVGNPITIIGKLEKKTKQKEQNIQTKQIIVYGLETIEDDRQKYIPTPDDLEKIKNIQQQNPDLVKYWATQLFTPIHGYQKIKESIIVQLIGTKTNIANGKTSRGFIHQALIGDAGSAKSTFLKLTQQYALKSRYTTGAGSSAVGLTAGVIRDEESGNFQLEAGALPLAHNGICMVDELDKMPEEQQDNLHEALEQGTQSISKGGIQATLPCQTSFLGAGNPKKSNIDINDDIYTQIPFKDTFINRMDLIWILTDSSDKEKDLAIGKKEIQNTKNNTKNNDEIKETIRLFKIYQYLAKKIDNDLSEKLEDEIPEWYANIRQTNNYNKKSIRINARTLNAIIRLTKSHARANLKQIATEENFNWARETIIESLGTIAIDIITGEIDVQKLETGTSHNEKKVIDIIRDYLNDGLLHEFTDIRKQISNQIPDREIETLIEKMHKHGEIIESPYGKYKLIK